MEHLTLTAEGKITFPAESHYEMEYLTTAVFELAQKGKLRVDACDVLPQNMQSLSKALEDITKKNGAVVSFEYDGPCNGTGLEDFKEYLRTLWCKSEAQMLEFYFTDDREPQCFLIGSEGEWEKAKADYIQKEIMNMLFNWKLSKTSVKKLIKTLNKHVETM